MSKAGLALLILVSVAVLSPAAAQDDESKIKLKELSKGIEEFNLGLIFRSFLTSGDTNLLISPFSVWSMLAVLSQGAGNSITRDEILGALGYNPARKYKDPAEAYSQLSPYFLVNTSTVELESFNSIFYSKDIMVNRNFIRRVQSTFRTKMTPIDFSAPSAVSTVNNAIYQATRGKIEEIVNTDDMKDSVMILTNAVFFKGQWTLPFNSSETTTAPFFDEQNREVGKVRMMFQRSPLPYANMQNFKSHVLELPYGEASCKNYVDDPSTCPHSTNPTGNKEENRLSMVIILPHRGVSLAEVIRLAPEISVASIFAALKQAAEEYEDDEVDIYLPRFKVTSDLILNKILTEMGVHEVFDPSYADLSNMSNTRNLHLSRVIHKATIEVTEEGTVASAVAAGELSDKTTPTQFKANRPFMYLIFEKSTNVILFGGTYVTPSIF